MREEFTNKTELTGSMIEDGANITPSDTVDLTNPTKTGIYVGGSGDLKVDLLSGATVTYYNLSAGITHPIVAKRIYATGTTATNIAVGY